MGWPENLHQTLDGRASCETVARILLYGPGLRGQARHLAKRAAAARASWWVSSMAEDWDRGAPDPGPQIAAAAVVFGQSFQMLDPAPDRLRALVAWLGEPLGWRPGMDWKADRWDARTLRQMTTTGRGEVLDVAAGIDPLAIPANRIGEGPLSRRQYNRRIRILRALDDKAGRMERAAFMRRLTLVGRGGFASEIPLERFAADPRAAAFVAWWVARRSRRRRFTTESRENPMDHLARELLARCERHPGTDWEMVAWAYPDPAVLARLDDGQRGALMGRWWQVMADAAMALAACWPAGQVNRLTMIVRRGMDSSTWNTLATAYNTARAGWLNTSWAAGGAALLEPMCPPKVMRLMAADLAYWHRASGGGVDPDTQVWAGLPFPWDVVAGAEECPRAAVAAACQMAGVDPEARGWTAPRAKGDVTEWAPTPELVHGVEVASPQWAALLRRAGVFGGHAKGTADAPALRAAAEEAGMVVGPLPVYDEQGAYQGHT